MKNRALALLVVGACGIAPQAWAHQLAYSKTEQIQVNVDGEATSWCKPEVAITMQRPTWDDQKPLNTLLSKLPYILGQECPTAQVTWKAVDAKGAVYATGAGNASNLGLATLTSPTAATAAAAPAVSVAPVASPPTPPAAVAAASVLPAVAAPTEPAGAAPVVAAPAPAPVTAPVIPQPAPEASPVPVQPVPVAQVPVTVAPVAAVATVPVESAPAAPPKPAAPAEAPAAVAAVPTGDFGRSLVLDNRNLMGITDGSGCKWVISKSVTDESDPSLSFASTPAMPCSASGYAEGSYDKLRWAVPNTYRGDTWSKITVHPSGLMFNQALVPAVKGKALSFLNSRADQALFQLGELHARSMKVYLAFERPNYRVLSPFSSDPYYVVITADEAFALDAVELKRAVVEVYQLVKATSPTTVGLSNLFFAKNFEALYPEGYASETKDSILKTRMGENRGEFYFDARQGNNFALRREEIRLREVRRLQQQMAELHTRVLARYEQLKSGMKEFEGREAEALAQMAGIKVTFPSPIAMQDPSSSKSAVPMMIHVTGKSGDFYEVDFPRKGRVQADAELESQWYVLPAANMTPFLPLEDGRAVPTYRVYTAGPAEACKQDHCADRVSFGAVLAKEFPSAGIDFNWTPAVSQQHVIDWQQASVQIQ
ncbi:hypothetical protein P5706_34845 [Pseudomonas sp. ChxA]|uniref:hypothetical protein n=1 Tax=Pseudomonas TaxID=286 RepID=UPI000995DFE0|nr:MULTISPECIES: hypothetical protein [Pseudomonas]MBJ2203720.1 hypothetical protein [Pseudomonas carnis]MDL2189349.1 hypothetical protein [Pseudomonas sp. ChxA]OOW06800.1 hypothetical protein MF6394_00555 [Pseudomonas sp. MF6394]